jgi:two-component system response regulator HydG
MQRLFQLIEQVASFDSPVLLRGETGTGKELVAKAIHAMGERCIGPFIPINCGAFTETLLESELFGHE